MALLPKVKLKALPTFPSSIIGGTGIETTKQNGAVVVDMAWNEFGTQSFIPTSPTNNVLTFDTATNGYIMVPSHLLGGAVAGIADAPNNGFQYGRQSANWTIITSNFIQAGTGAVTRTMQDKTRDFVSIRDFGAVGDLIADDTAAIQAAVDSVAINGGTVYFPNGNYLITAAINVTTNYVTLSGGSFGSSAIYYSGATINGIFFNGGSGKTGGGIRNLSIFATGVAKTDGAAVRVQNWNDFRIENFSIYAPWRGLWVTDCFFFHAAQGNIIAPVPGSGVGVVIDSVTFSAASHIFSNIIVQGIAGSECFAGFLIQFSGGTWLYACQGIGCTTGLYITPPAGRAIEHIWSFGCAWDTNLSYGIFIDCPASATVHRAYFIGDWTCTNGVTGVLVSATGTVDDIAFLGHRSYNNQHFGMEINLAVNVRVHDSTIAGNGGAAANSYDGIAVNASNVSIKNNRIGNAAGFAVTQRYGILLNGTNSNVEITGNNLFGNVTAALLNNMTSITSRFEGNIGYNPVGVATGVSSGTSPFTYRAGPSPETLYLMASGGISGLAHGGIAVLPAPVAGNICVTVYAGPNETIAVTFTGTVFINRYQH